MRSKFVNYYILSLLLGGCLTSCNDFLDREPLSVVNTEDYFSDASQLESYLNQLYADILPSHKEKFGYGIFGIDAGTDNQVRIDADDRYADGFLKVPHEENKDWNFELIYRCNYFITEVEKRFGTNPDGLENTISGDLSSIKHYLGEGYFLRACEYFNRYQKFGDFPIIKTPLKEDLGVLSEASKRFPRNEVARFILSDLDKAYTFLSAKQMSTTRINMDVALLLKSRVALFEGTWLRYFKDTPFVPKSEGWPGNEKDYNSGYEFPGESIDNEINYFLEQAIESSDIVAKKYIPSLAINTQKLQQDVNEQPNPYYDMFAMENLSGVGEVLLWRQYARDMVTHNVNSMASRGNNNIGITKGLVNSFLMQDGKPVYAHMSNVVGNDNIEGDGYYKGDQTIANVKANRDTRLQIFLKEPGQKNILIENIEGDMAIINEGRPDFKDLGYVTGYALRKGGSFDQKHYGNGAGYTAAVSYRATEALLNYIEASYERYHDLSLITDYWTELRKRAGIEAPIQVTIDATDIEKEKLNDWGAFSAGKLLTDKVLYNIRRERRCELMAEGLRFMDLCRWRSMDQMITIPYFVEGIHLWNTEMESWYKSGELIADGSDEAIMSSPEISEYVRPHQRKKGQICSDGYRWHMAHYLSPIMIKQFLITSPDGATVSESPLYQNPYWPLQADMPAEQ